MSAEMPAAQRKVYDAFKKQAKDAMNANGGKAFDMLPYLTKLRQICVDPGLLLENYHGEAAKLDLLMELVNDYLKEGHRILIFSQFVKALEAIEKRLEIPYFKITGDTDSKIRLKICEDFNNGSEENIVLISLKDDFQRHAISFITNIKGQNDKTSSSFMLHKGLQATILIQGFDKLALNDHLILVFDY